MRVPVFGNVPGKCAARGRNYLSQPRLRGKKKQQHELKMQQLVIVNHHSQCFHIRHSRVYGCLATCSSNFVIITGFHMSSVNSRENRTSTSAKYTISKYTRTLMCDCTSPHGNHTSRFLHIVNARCLLRRKPVGRQNHTTRWQCHPGLIRFLMLLNLSETKAQSNIDSVEYVPLRSG